FEVDADDRRRCLHEGRSLSRMDRESDERKKLESEDVPSRILRPSRRIDGDDRNIPRRTRRIREIRSGRRLRHVYLRKVFLDGCSFHERVAGVRSSEGNDVGRSSRESFPPALERRTARTAPLAVSG